MRVLSLLAAAGFALAASPAFAACGDPGTTPSVAGKTFVGSDINYGTTARRPTLSNRTVFNADCTVTQIIGNGGDTKTFKGTWTQVGVVLTVGRAQPVKGGRPAQVAYDGKVGNDGWIRGNWNGGAKPGQSFEWRPVADAFPCGKPSPSGDLTGSTLKGTAVSPTGVTVPIELELNTNCTAFLFGLDFYYAPTWKQTDGKLNVKAARRAWVGMFDGKAVNGRLLLLQDFEYGDPFIPLADLPKGPRQLGTPGDPRGTFTLTRRK